MLGCEKRPDTETFGSGWVTQEKTYNARGMAATTTQPRKPGEAFQTFTTNYDLYLRPTSVSSSVAAFGTTTMAYGYFNSLLTTTTTNPAGQVTTSVTDASGQGTKATDSGGTLDYAYNSQGNLLSVAKDGTILTSSAFDGYESQTPRAPAHQAVLRLPSPWPVAHLENIYIF